MNVPRTTCVVESRMKTRNRRGPSWDEASERATSVIEKTTPAIVIIDPAMTPITALAPSAPPVNVQPKLSATQSVTLSSTATLAKADATATPAMIAGMNQKPERTRFQNLKNCPLKTLAPQSLACHTQPSRSVVGSVQASVRQVSPDRSRG
jgi:hypothetical protein